MVSDGDAYAFLAKFAPAGTVCRCGGITRLFTAAQLASFDVIISINNVPAVIELTRIGVGERVILLDSLLHWRQGREKIRLYAPIWAYLVQDFPGVAQCSCPCPAHNIYLVAPMQWAPAVDRAQTITRFGVTLCLGGVTSALVSWDSIKNLIAALVMGTAAACKLLEIPLTVIGNDLLRELDVASYDSLSVLGMVDPLVASKLIAHSQLLMTTPGIGTIYEGLGTSTPILLMPPNNSTQLQQYQLLVNAGFPHVLAGCPALAQLYQIADCPWHQQADLCARWLHQQIDKLPVLVHQSISALYAGSVKFAHAAMIAQQRPLFNRLSRLDVNEVLQQLIA